MFDDLRIASPCNASWDDMVGDDRVRHCKGCDKDVYNLSGMTRVDAEALLVARGVDVCIRFYQRADGTLMLRDCEIKRGRTSRIAAAVGIAALALGATACMGKRAMPKPRIVAVGDRVDHGDGTLRVTLHDSRAATLYVDGYEVPLGATLDVVPGYHDVSVVSDGVESHKSVQLDRDGWLELDLDLDHESRIK